MSPRSIWRRLFSAAGGYAQAPPPPAATGDRPRVDVGAVRLPPRFELLELEIAPSAGPSRDLPVHHLVLPGGALLVLGIGAGEGLVEARLAAGSLADGRAALAVFERALGATAPLPSWQGTPVGWRGRAALFGRQLVRRDDGGFDGPEIAGRAGDWTVLKLALEGRGLEAELLVHLDPAARRGFIAERDASMRPALLALLARLLRDGPPPERSAATDERISDAGPRFVEPERVGGPETHAYGFAGDGELLLLGRSSPDGIDVVVRGPGGEEETLARAGRHLLVALADAAPARKILLWEVLTDRDRVASNRDPVALSLVDRDAGTRERLTGPWGELHVRFGRIPFSPEGRYLAIVQWRPGIGRHLDGAVHLLDVAARTSRFVHVPGARLDVLGWRASAGRARAVLVDGDEGPFAARRAWLADAAAGSVEPIAAASVAELDPERRGERHATLSEDGRIVVTDLRTGEVRSLPLDPDERARLEPGSLEWVSDRYLFLAGERPSFVDVATMTMSFPMPAVGEQPTLLFDRAFTRVAIRTSGGVELARVVLPGS